jgi:hypothetical protein
MKGLEPSTFCMARTGRELTGADLGRHFDRFCASHGPPADPGCLQLTSKADMEADTELGDVIDAFARLGRALGHGRA